MRSIRVHFDDGQTIETNINGTNDEIRRYYVGQRFEFDETKPCHTATLVEFLDESPTLTLTTPLQFDGRASVIGLEETNPTSGTITFDEIGTAYEVTTTHPSFVILTTRDELARRLRAYRRTTRRRPDSYNANLGIGRVPKHQNKTFTGWGIDGNRYERGVIVFRPEPDIFESDEDRQRVRP